MRIPLLIVLGFFQANTLTPDKDSAPCYFSLAAGGAIGCQPLHFPGSTIRLEGEVIVGDITTINLQSGSGISLSAYPNGSGEVTIVVSAAGELRGKPCSVDAVGRPMLMAQLPNGDCLDMVVVTADGSKMSVLGQVQ